MKNKSIQCELNIYIGFSGADSSGAKSSFEKNQSVLNKKHIYFLGQNLENAPVKLFSWQNKSTNLPDLLAKKSENSIDKEIIECLTKNLDYLKTSGAQKALWFNELFIDCGNMIIPVIRGLIEKNKTNLKIICVVDEPSETAWYTYRSIGLIHKIFKGKVKTFGEFYDEFKFNPLKKLNPFLISFKSSMSVLCKKNPGKSKTLFQILCGALEVNAILDEVKSPHVTNEELYLRFVFNNNLTGVGYHHFFNDEFNFTEVEIPSYKEFVDNYINYNDANFIKNLDKDVFNIILDNNNQSPLKFKSRKHELLKLDKDLLLKMLLSSVVNKAKSRVR